MAAQIRTLPEDMTDDDLRTEIIYTKAKLLADKITEGLVPKIVALQAEHTKLRARHDEVIELLAVGQAHADKGDWDLDQIVTSVIKRLVYVYGQGSPAYKRYVKEAPSKIIAPKLAVEMPKVSTWPESLAKEKDTELLQLGKKLKAALGTGRTALDRADSAEATRADYRSKERPEFLKKANTARALLLADLLKMQAEHDLPEGWATSFFRKESRQTPKSSSRKGPGTIAKEPQ